MRKWCKKNRFKCGDKIVFSFPAPCRDFEWYGVVYSISYRWNEESNSLVVDKYIINVNGRKVPVKEEDMIHEIHREDRLKQLLDSDRYV